MASFKIKLNYNEENYFKDYFNNATNFIGFTKCEEEGTILFTDEEKVVKYQLESQKILQEWRREAGSCTRLSCVAVQYKSRFYAITDELTIISWKSTSMFIDRKPKKFEMEKPCQGLISFSGFLFVVFKDGSMRLLDDPNITWDHNLSRHYKLTFLHELEKDDKNLDVFLIFSTSMGTKVFKHEVCIEGDLVVVKWKHSTNCQSFLSKFKTGELMNVLFLDEFQCIVHGKVNDKEGMYLVNERRGSMKECNTYDLEHHGKIILFKKVNGILMLVTSRNLFEIQLSYEPPLFCNIIRESMEDCYDNSNDKCSTFENICDRLKTWVGKEKKICNLNEAVETFNKSKSQFQDFMKSNVDRASKEKSTLEEKLILIPLLCRHSVNLQAGVLVGMLSFVLKLKDEEFQSTSRSSQLNHIVDAQLPDDISKHLRSVEFQDVEKLMTHLYDEMVNESIGIEKVINLMSLLLDSHHTQFMLAKELEIVQKIRFYVNAMCDEAKKDSWRRSMEKIRFLRVQKRMLKRSKYYVETFIL